MSQELHADESFEVEGLGTLKPLTMSQMAELRFAIGSDLIGLATQTLSGNEKAVAASAIAMQIANMNMFEQAKTIIYAPSLRAQAAHMMMTKKMKSFSLVGEHINSKNSDDLHRAIWSSYGFEFGTEEGENRSDPPNGSTTSESVESSPPSTDGQPATSET